jgi:ABC-type nitrate/sulfonate/bicarbonate transport system substrate-binding protein
MKTLFKILFVFAVFILVLTPIKTHAADSQRLRIAYTSLGISFGPLWLTKEAGIFKKYDIDAELLYIAGGPLATQALIGGDVGIALASAAALISSNLSGSDVVILGATIRTLPFQLYAISSIKEPAQLRETKLGVSRLGATTDFVARYLLKKWGLEPNKDVAIFQTGSVPQIFVAMEGGSIQSGILSTGPDTLRAEAEGYTLLADVSTLGLAYPLGPFGVRRASLERQPDLISRFVKAYVEGIHRFKTDKVAALATLEKYMRQKVTPASEKIYEVYAAKYIQRVPEATPAAIQTILDEISARRPLPPGVTPQRFIEPKFMRELVSSGFVDSLYRDR